ncbi:MAG: hypothetical protein M3Q79_01760 [bacterium]|nr:hypothetical protein [bacterium]
MKKSVNRRHKIENEVVFRKANEKVSKGLDAIKVAATAEGYNELLIDQDLPLYFFCECSSENCKERIKLKQSTYDKLHSNSRQFVIKPGHIEPEVEKTVRKSKQFIVVEKFEKPPKNVSSLKQTVPS